MAVDIVVTDEHGLPVHCTVAAIKTSDQSIISLTTTDANGLASIGASGTWYPRPMVSPDYKQRLKLTILNNRHAATYDYVVDSTGGGTHLTVRAMIADYLIDIAALGTTAVRSCWLATDDTDTGIEISIAGSQPNGTLVIDGPGGPNDSRVNTLDPRVRLIKSSGANDGYFKATVGGAIPHLIFRNIGLKSLQGATDYLLNITVAAGAVLPALMFYDCKFNYSNGGVLLNNSNANDMGFYYVQRCTGIIGSFATGKVGTLELDGVKMTVASLSTSEDADPLIVRNSEVTVTDHFFAPSGNTFGKIILQNDYFISTAASAKTFLATTDLVAHTVQIVIQNVFYRQTGSTGSVFANLNSGGTSASSRTDTVLIDGLWMIHDGAGVGTGPAITVAGNFDKVSIGIVDGFNWTTVSSLTSTGVGSPISHSLLTNLAADDHAQYLRTDGTRALTGTWAPGAQKIGVFDFQAKPSDLLVGDAAFHIGLGIDIGGATTNEGKTTIGANLNVDVNANKTTVRKTVLTGGLYTGISVYTTAGTTGHAALYDGSLNLLATGPTTTLTSGAFTFLPFTTVQTLAAGTYYIGISSDHNAFLAWDAGAAGDGQKQGTYDSNPLAGSTATTNNYSMYITGYLLAHGPRVEFDATDYLEYDRTNNRHQFYIGSSRLGYFAKDESTANANDFILDGDGTRNGRLSIKGPVGANAFQLFQPYNDANPKLAFTSTASGGRLSYGPGGAGAIDTNLDRASVGGTPRLTTGVFATTQLNLQSDNAVFLDSAENALRIAHWRHIVMLLDEDNNDTTALFRIMTNGATIATATDLLNVDESGDIRVLGYSRVGSLAAPSNTTAGDLTALRLHVGTDAAFTAGVTAAELVGRSRIGGTDAWLEFANFTTIGNLATPAAGNTRLITRLNADLAAATNFKTLWGKDENAFESAMSLRARTLFPKPLTLTTGAVAGTALPANNTSALVSHLEIPEPIKINKILYNVSGAGNAANVIRIAIYSENGTQKYIDVTDAVGAATGVRTIDITDTTLAPGVYLILICHSTFSTTACSVSMYTVDTNITAHIASEPDLGGTLTISAGAAPATIDPTALTTVAPNNTCPVIRLLGVTLGS